MEIQNAAQVALEAGNRPQMIFKHDRDLVRSADAKTWFAITPGEQGKTGNPGNLVALAVVAA